jgi:hypothetical protein
MASATVVVPGNTGPSAHAERAFGDSLDEGYLPSEEVRDEPLGQVEGRAHRRGRRTASGPRAPPRSRR